MWTTKSTLLVVTRCLRLRKLQTEIGEQSPMQTKRDSWLFLVKRRHDEPCGLRNLQRMPRRMLHYTTHVPYRDWCPFCVASCARGSPHRRVVNKTSGTLPKFQADHMFIRTVAESKTLPCITCVDTRSGSVGVHEAAEDEDEVAQVQDDCFHLAECHSSSLFFRVFCSLAASLASNFASDLPR